jgi:hypothetical protein
MLHNVYKKIEGAYIAKINNIFLLCGGVNKTFKLETKEVTFAILKPSKFNIGFFMFSHLKFYVVFKKIFKIILKIPYFFTETFIGSFIVSIFAIWAVIGREPITTIFCFSFVIEFWTFLIFMGYFLRLEGVYDYCLDEYGCSFVEKYIDNPFTASQIKTGVRLTATFVVAMGVDQYDRSNCCTNSVWEARENIAMLKEQGISLKKEDILKIQETARANHIPRVDSFSESIKNMLVGLSKK